MPFTLNLTADYHRGKLNTLGWEMTVSNALYPQDSPCRSVLKDPSSYGRHLYDYLAGFFPLSEISRVLEVGGGYGYLMREFLECNPRCGLSWWTFLRPCWKSRRKRSRISM
jgi:hypothetical protein